MPPTMLPRANRFASLLVLSAIMLGVCETTTRGQPPAKTEVPTVKLRWEVELKTAPNYAVPIFDRDGTVLVLTGRGGGRTDGLSFNPRTGKPGMELKYDSVLPFSYPLEKGKIGYQIGSGFTQFVVWDSATGKATASNFPAAGQGTPQRLWVPGNAKYFAVASEAGREVEAPFKVFDSKTSKAVLSLEVKGAKAYFAHDGSRVLVRDSYDRYRWFKLPSGQLDGEWKYDRENGTWPGEIYSMTADGSTLVYYGRSPKQRADGHAYYLIDGKTGEEKHAFSPQMIVQLMSISPEGDTLAILRRESGISTFAVDVYDIKSGKLTLAGRVIHEIPPTSRTTPESAISWEARSLAVYDHPSKKLWVYELPGGSGGGLVVTRPNSRDAGNRIAIPNDTAVAKAEAAIRQVLKDDYAKKSVADQKAFAAKLIKLADETADDPVARYVMLRDARDFAQGAADPAITLLAVDSLAKWYQIDGPAQQLASLEKILAGTVTAATAKLIADAAASSSAAAADVDELDEAVEFATLAVTAVKKAKLPTAAVDEAEANLALAKKSRDAFATIRPALEKLKATPDDAAANSVVGKYRCFIQNRWDDGLKHLAKGDDAALRVVAELDLKTPRTGAPEDSKLADAWWEYAQAAPPGTQWGSQFRTRYWYARSIPGLTGLNKARAEGRVSITVAGTEYRPGLLSEFTAKQPAVLKGKKARLDPGIDFSGGEFSDTKQTDLTVKWTGALAPQRDGRYTIVAQTTDPVRVRIDGKLVIDTTSGGSQKREAVVTLGEKVTPIVVEYFAPNTDKHRIKLAWTVPGGTAEEPIPAECLFHDKKAEAALGK